MYRPLNPKQLKFIEHYLATGNAKQSYIKAGYKGRGRTAENNASRLLGNAGVAAAIAAANKKALEAAGLTAEIVVAEMAKIGFLDPRRLFNPDGTMKEVRELDDSTAVAVASLEVEEVTTTSPNGVSKVVVRTKKLRFWDKRLALFELGNRFDAWGAKPSPPATPVETNVNVDLAIEFPARAAIAGFLRDNGFPGPGGVPPNGDGQPPFLHRQ